MKEIRNVTPIADNRSVQLNATDNGKITGARVQLGRHTHTLIPGESCQVERTGATVNAWIKRGDVVVIPCTRATVDKAGKDKLRAICKKHKIKPYGTDTDALRRSICHVFWGELIPTVSVGMGDDDDGFDEVVELPEEPPTSDADDGAVE